MLEDSDVIPFTGKVKTFFWRSTSLLCYNQRRKLKFLPYKFFILCISQAFANDILNITL